MGACGVLSRLYYREAKNKMPRHERLRLGNRSACARPRGLECRHGEAGDQVYVSEAGNISLYCLKLGVLPSSLFRVA